MVSVLVEIRIAQTMSIHTVPTLVRQCGYAVNFSDNDESSERSGRLGGNGRTVGDGLASLQQPAWVATGKRLAYAMPGNALKSR
jgi:hypothetical protein